MRTPSTGKPSHTQTFLLTSLLTVGSLSNIGCNPNADISSNNTDPNVRTATLEHEVRVLSKQNELQNERLAALNAEIPGGLAMAEREKQLEQREVRLSALEGELEQLRIEANASTENLKQEAQDLSRERINFTNEQRELLIQIGEAQQINDRYDAIMKEKENAVLGEREANLRVDRAVRFITFSCAFTFLSCLVALAYRARLITERRRITTVLDLTDVPSLPKRNKKLGKGHDPYRFLRDFDE